MSDDEAVEMPRTVEVVYCGVCGLPCEYCEYGVSFDKCKEWMAAHEPELFEQFKDEESKGKAKAKAPRELTDREKEKAERRAKMEGRKYKQTLSTHTSSTASSTHTHTHTYTRSLSLSLCNCIYPMFLILTCNCPRICFLSPLAGKPHLDLSTPHITVARAARSKRKFVTVVTGVSHFAKPRPVCKVLSNTFSCGAAAVKGAEDEIVIQGDVHLKVKDILVEQFNVPEEKIIIVSGDVKIKAVGRRPK